MKIIKKMALIFMGALLVCSCSNDDDKPDNGQSQNLLIGTWQVIEIIGQHSTFGTETATDVQGTITFNANGTGKENYSFTAFGIPNFENDAFTWVSTSSELITDPNSSSELKWERLTNTSTTQKARYGDSQGFNYTVTLSK